MKAQTKTDLPVSAAQKIMGYLEQKTPVTLVSRGWNRIFIPILYEKSILSDKETFSFFIQTLSAKNGSNVKTLVITASASDYCEMGDLVDIISKCENISHFTLQGFFHLSSILIEELKRNCMCLEQVVLWLNR